MQFFHFSWTPILLEMSRQKQIRFSPGSNEWNGPLHDKNRVTTNYLTFFPCMHLQYHPTKGLGVIFYAHIEKTSLFTHLLSQYCSISYISALILNKSNRNVPFPTVNSSPSPFRDSNSIHTSQASCAVIGQRTRALSRYLLQSSTVWFKGTVKREQSIEQSKRDCVIPI